LSPATFCLISEYKKCKENQVFFAVAQICSSPALFYSKTFVKSCYTATHFSNIVILSSWRTHARVCSMSNFLTFFLLNLSSLLFILFLKIQLTPCLHRRSFLSCLILPLSYYFPDFSPALLHLIVTLQKIFHICIHKRDLAQPHFEYLLIISKKGLKCVCLEIWYSGEKHSSRCSHSAVSIGTTYFQTELWIFNSTGDSYFQIKTIKMVPLICYFLFWSIDLGFGIEVWQIPFGIMHSKSQLNRGIFNVYFLN
jgi:hypothetical protein